jgi:hypothetical protein
MDAYIVVSALMSVMFVVRHSVIVAVSLNMDAYIVASALMFVMFVVRHSVIGAV